MLEIVLTREDANSESALLVEWAVDDRAEVSEGQVVCVIETSKSAIEIESPGTGTLLRFVRAGEEVELGGRIAVVAADAAELAALELLAVSEPSQATPEGSGKATRKAVELAAEHGVDLSRISKSGFITAEDVLAAVARHEPERGPVPLVPGLDRVSLEGVSLPAALTADRTAGRLDSSFFASLRGDPDAVRALPANERLDLYRRNGASIEAGVRLGEATVIVSPRIVLGAGVQIGDGGTVTCEEVFSVGELTSFERGLRLRSRRAFIGAGGYFSEDVHIGGGGARDPEATLVIGDDAFVGAEAFINVCRAVVIGREVFVTMRSVLVTHNVGHSLLEGYENRFAPIVIEDRAQVGIGVVIYAGCRVGTGAIVASNSYVVSDIPPGKLAIGVPARVSGSSSRTLSESRRSELAATIFAELRALLEGRGHSVDTVDDGFAVVDGGRTSQILLVPRLGSGFRSPEVDGETVILTLGLDGEAPAGASVLDLLARRVHGSGGVVLDSVREFCRKRGIRFQPGPWRYSGGLV